MRSAVGSVTVSPRSGSHEGPVLASVPLSLRLGSEEGGLLSYAVQGRLAENEDPWPLVDSWLRDPSAHPEATLASVARCRARGPRSPRTSRAAETALSVFDLLRIRRRGCTSLPSETRPASMLVDRHHREPVPDLRGRPLSVEPVAVTVDRGVFPADRDRAAHPLPDSSRVDEAVDPRRVRACSSMYSRSG